MKMSFKGRGETGIPVNEAKQCNNEDNVCQSWAEVGWNCFCEHATAFPHG